MSKGWGWLPAAFLGALLGFVVGLGMESVLDPTGDRVDVPYTDSQRLRLILLYAVLGAIAGAAIWIIGERSRKRSSGGVPAGAAVAALALVVAAGVVPVFLVDPDETPAPTNIRAAFVANCVKTSTEGTSFSKSQGKTYCGCLVATLAKGRTRTELNRLLVVANRSVTKGTAPPKPALKAAEICAKKARS